ncbi:MAG: RNA polymerase sigma factor [Phycisphaerales bacterium JB052]
MVRDEVQALMMRMHRGDERAAEMLWARLSARLIAYARVLLPKGHQSSAEDVVQGVFVKVLRMRRGALRKVTDGTAFMFRITRNEAINAGRGELREQARRRRIEEREQHVHETDEVQRMIGAIEDLVYEQREVILLRYIGGLTIDQVGEALGVNRNTVASRSRLGMERLRETMGAALNEVHDG